MRLRKRQIAFLVSILLAGLSWLSVRYLPTGALGSSEIQQGSSATTTASVDVDPDIDSPSESSSDTAVRQQDGRVKTDEGATGIITNATVLHVVDGDTLDADLDGVGKVRIRMLGVNTPETVDPRKTVECFGKEASNFSKKTLAVGSAIRLEPDPQADERDKYGRLLRNIILADGTDYNALLVENGYAYAYLGFPLDPKRKTQLKKLEQTAKAEKRGLWGAGCH